MKKQITSWNYDDYEMGVDMGELLIKLLDHLDLEAYVEEDEAGFPHITIENANETDN